MKTIKSNHLSSAEYQKAKNLKGFNKDDWKWNPETGLYVYVKTIEVTNLEMQFLTALVKCLYAEAGFSDVDIKDIAKEMKIRIPEAKGIMGSLTKKGLVYPNNDYGPPIIELPYQVYNLHPRWMEENNGFGVEQVNIVEK